MKNIIFMFSLLAFAPSSHAYLTGCGTSGDTYVSSLQIVKNERCLGGEVALVDAKGIDHCTRTKDFKPVAPGLYRACLEMTEYGVIISKIEAIAAE